MPAITSFIVPVPFYFLSAQNERSEEHTSELQSHVNLVCRLLLEKKKNSIQPAAAGRPVPSGERSPALFLLAGIVCDVVRKWCTERALRRRVPHVCAVRSQSRSRT